MSYNVNKNQPVSSNDFEGRPAAKEGARTRNTTEVLRELNHVVK
jgi:hypothetical protein